MALILVKKNPLDKKLHEFNNFVRRAKKKRH